MSVQTTESTTPRPTSEIRSHPLPAEIDAGCRTPLLLLFSKSIGWLILSLLFGVLASIKLHAPGMLADVAALTYGRVAAASSAAFYYGFASQAAIAVALWLFARLGKTHLVLPRASIVAGVVWNLAVLIGVVGILAGGMTHFQNFEMPPWVAPILLASFLALGLSGLLTHLARSEKETYPSSWFLVTAFFVFPWILSTAYLLLGYYPVRGVLQPIFATWYANNFMTMWLAPIALAILFYFVSKLSQQPLYSYAWTAFGFWLYIILVPFSGFQNLYAVPNWMPRLSSLINALLAFPVLAMAYAWYKTWAGHNRAKKQKDPSSKYVSFSAVSFVVGGILLALASCPVVDEVVGLTMFVPGVYQYIGYGFIGMALFAAIIHIVPRLSDIDWPRPGLLKAHFGLSVAGIVLSILALLLGGFVQGQAWNNPNVSVIDATRRVIPYVGLNTIALLLLLFGQLALFANMASMLKTCCGLGKEAK